MPVQADDPLSYRSGGGHEALNPVQFGPFYHGTRDTFAEGDKLTTKGAKQALLKSGVKPVNAQHRQVYVTGDLGMARTMARDYSGDHVTPGHVYKVQPMGSLHDDPEVSHPAIGNQGQANYKPGYNPTHSYVTSDPVRINEEVPGW